MTIKHYLAMPSYNLAVDAYVCFANRHIVFSDLRDDRYRCLSEENSSLIVEAFPAFAKDTSQLAPAGCRRQNERLERLMTALASEDLVTTSSDGRPFAPIEVPTPGVSLLNDTQRQASSAPSRHLARFIYAAAKASAKLRTQSIRITTARVGARRLRAEKGARPELLHEFNSAFHRLRPSFPRAYLCRFDSLALMDFLATNGCHPLWVFGVRCEPFGAHCWVQDGEYVLNETLEVVREYTPIMAF